MRRTEPAPRLSTLVRRTVERALAQARVAIPARVVSFDPLRRTVSAQPIIRPPLPEGGNVAEPELRAVPVVYPGTGRHRVLFPLAAGDTVLLVFLDHASDEWALSLLLPEATDPRPKSPAELRSHDVADPVAIPLATIGVADAAEIAAGTQGLADRLLVQNGSAQLALQDGGKVALGRHVAGGPSIEVVDQLVQALAVLEGAFPALAAIKTALISIRGTL